MPTKRRILNMDGPNDGGARTATSSRFSCEACRGTDAAAAAGASALGCPADRDPLRCPAANWASIGIALISTWCRHRRARIPICWPKIHYARVLCRTADAERLKLEANGAALPRSRTHQRGRRRGADPLDASSTSGLRLAELVRLHHFLRNWGSRSPACGWIQWDARGISLQYVAVNVSRQQFRDPRFKDAVREGDRADRHRSARRSHVRGGIVPKSCRCTPGTRRCCSKIWTAIKISLRCRRFRHHGYSSLRLPATKSLQNVRSTGVLSRRNR